MREEYPFIRAGFIVVICSPLTSLSRLIAVNVRRRGTLVNQTILVVHCLLVRFGPNDDMNADFSFGTFMLKHSTGLLFLFLFLFLFY